MNNKLINKQKKPRNSSTFVENFIKADLLNPIDWQTKSCSAQNRAALGKAKKNGVSTAVSSAPKQLIGR